MIHYNHLAQGRYSFRIPDGTRAVGLLSRSARPSDSISLFVDDRRRLGVAVEKLVQWQGLDDIEIPAAAIALSGWHAAEGDVRWTNGVAAFDLPAGEGVTTLDIHVAATLSYRFDKAAEGAQDAAQVVAPSDLAKELIAHLQPNTNGRSALRKSALSHYE